MVGPEFASCWLKIGRAEEHFTSFKEELETWTNSNPYSISQKSDSEGFHHSLVLDIGRPFPSDRWSLIAGDCAHNLRSALDHLVYALAVQKSGTNPPPNFKRLQFPITDTPEAFEQQMSRISSLSAKAQAFIQQVQPYNRPYQILPTLLSVLNEFDNSDKHRLITLTLNHLIGGKIDFIPPMAGGGPEIHWLRTAATSGTEVAFFEMNPPQHVTYAYDVSFCVTVTHIPGPTGRHVSPLEDVLRSLVTEVKRLVNEAITI